MMTPIAPSHTPDENDPSSTLLETQMPDQLQQLTTDKNVLERVTKDVMPITQTTVVHKPPAQARIEPVQSSEPDKQEPAPSWFSTGSTMLLDKPLNWAALHETQESIQNLVNVPVQTSVTSSTLNENLANILNTASSVHQSKTSGPKKTQHRLRGKKI